VNSTHECVCHECVCDILPSNQCKAEKGDHKCKCQIGHRLAGICLANHNDRRKRLRLSNHNDSEERLSRDEIGVHTWSRSSFLSSPPAFNYQRGNVVEINDRDPIQIGILRNYSSIQPSISPRYNF